MAVLSKTDAAERLIVSGIMMREAGVDPLAIHVVAASALNMLRELIQLSGDDYAAFVLRQGLFHAASAQLKGAPVNLPTTPQIDGLIGEIATGILKGAILQPDDLKVTLSAAELRKQLNYIVQPFNFLKHADRDPLATLDEGDVDPDGAIMHALTAYSMLCPGKALPDKVRAYLEAHDLT